VIGIWPLLALSGAVLGLGFVLVVRAWSVPVPQLSDALDNLSGSSRRWEAVGRQSEPDSWIRLAGPAGRGLVARLAAGPVALPTADLELIGWTPEGFLTRKALSALGGALIFPLVIAVAAGLVGVPLPLAVPMAVSIGLAAAGWFLPNLVVADQARVAREELRRAVCSYLDLVSLRRDASEGPTQALERAADVGDGWAFQRIRAALIDARVAGGQPWDGLRLLGERTGVSELSDVADIAATAAVDGAAIVTTLRARAASLRAQLLTEDEAEANARSEKMSLPAAVMALAYTILLGYPAFSVIAFG